MKFSCPKCTKQYELSAKLQGKLVKVRCTSCGTAFKLRVSGPASAPAVSADAEPTGPIPGQGRPAAAPAARPAPARPEPPAATLASARIEVPAARVAPARPEAPQPKAPAARPAAPAAQPAAPVAQASAPAAQIAPVAAPRPEAPRQEEPAAAPDAATAVSGPAIQQQIQYFAVVGSKRLGPMPFAALKRLVEESKIKETTLLWHKGMAGWTAAASVKDVASLFAEIPKPGALGAFPAAVMPPPLPPAAPARPAAAPVPKSLPAVEAAPAARGQDSQARTAMKAAAEAEDRFIGEDTGEQLVGPVEISTIDSHFFDARARQTHEHIKGMDQIELSDGPMFPMDMETRTSDKSAKASLKDFSVMVKMSRRTRTRQVGALTASVAVVGLVFAVVFSVYDPLDLVGSEGPAAQEEAPQEEFKGMFAQSKAAKKSQDGADEEGVVRGGVELSADENLKNLDKEWSVTIDDEVPSVNAEALAARLRTQPGNAAGANGASSSGSSGTKPKQYKTGQSKGSDASEDGEMSLAEFALTAERKPDSGNGKVFEVKDSGKGGTAGKTEGGKAGAGMESSMSNLLGGPSTLSEQNVDAKVAHREGDGLALKAKVAQFVSKKVSGERSRLGRCVKNHGLPAGGDTLKANLHFTEQGNVSNVSIADAPPGLEDCFLTAFDGWRLELVNKKIKIPISVRFQ